VDFALAGRDIVADARRVSQEKTAAAGPYNADLAIVRETLFMNLSITTGSEKQGCFSALDPAGGERPGRGRYGDRKVDQ